MRPASVVIKFFLTVTISKVAKESSKCLLLRILAESGMEQLSA